MPSSISNKDNKANSHFNWNESFLTMDFSNQNCNLIFKTEYYFPMDANHFCTWRFICWTVLRELLSLQWFLTRKMLQAYYYLMLFLCKDARYHIQCVLIGVNLEYFFEYFLAKRLDQCTYLMNPRWVSTANKIDFINFTFFFFLILWSSHIYVI
jgi:hypothetical protein